MIKILQQTNSASIKKKETKKNYGFMKKPQKDYGLKKITKPE